MATSRRSRSPSVGKKTSVSVDWVVRCASDRIANIFTYRTINGRSTPNSEMDIEMQAVDLDPDEHDNDDGDTPLSPGKDLESQASAVVRRRVGHPTRLRTNSELIAMPDLLSTKIWRGRWN